MTEDEAKTKWCPMVRNVIAGVTEGPKPLIEFLTNRDSDNLQLSQRDGLATSLSKCIGSACMAWRGQPIDGTSPEQHGYCGLAGKP